MDSSHYPTPSLLPKEITQAAEFISKYPTFDGRDTVIAILDTGIDPAASGMQKTSTGKRKVIDFIDCTGAGDVEMGSAQKCSDERPLELVGDSGRTLKLNPKWKNPSGNWYVGSKPLYSIAPDEVINEISSERLSLFTKKLKAMKEHVQKQQLEENDGLNKDLAAQGQALDYLHGMYDDHGPLLDCVVFHDGSQWLAAIDTKESGDFSEISGMGAYKDTGDIGMLCEHHLLYFTINFYDDGRILSIVTPSMTHSTHVAGIAAAFQPEEPANIGIAPGAQLLSLCVGDKRVHGMETGIALTRAANAIIEYGVDLANLSFGEPTSVPNSGQWVNIIKEKVINHHRCTFVSSGGNSGPALTTLSAPGGTTDDIIGVGAYLPKEQMKANYSMLNPTEEKVFHWCSFGPAANGGRGVDIFAPGSATTSYPLYTKEMLKTLEGTSMAAPNVCGSIALLISAWKQTYGSSAERLSPYRIRNAILSTARDIGHELGAGLIQVNAAWEFLQKHTSRSYEDINLCVVNSDQNDMSGIYLRNACDSNVPRYFSLKVVPKFHKDPKADGNNNGINESSKKRLSEMMSKYEQRILLKSTVSWVKAAESVYVSSAGNVFEVCIDATNLEAGLLHTGSILGYDSSDVERGPVFDYPVTVTKPLEVGSTACISFDDLEIKPTNIVRRFINVPVGATAAEMIVAHQYMLDEGCPPGEMKIHLVQLLPETRTTNYEHSILCRAGHKGFMLGKDVSEKNVVKAIKVVGNNTLELCIYSSFKSQGTYNVSIQLSFSGIVPVAAMAGNDVGNATIVLNGNRAVERVDLTALVCHEYKLNPRISFNYLCRSLRPSESHVAYLYSKRDVHPATGSAAYRLNLGYKLSCISDYTNIRLRMPGIDSMVYESWADDFRLAIFDANKHCIARNTSYTSNVYLKKKGDYFIKVQISHKNKYDLENLLNTCLLVQTKIDPIRLPNIHYQLSQAFTGSFGQREDPSKIDLGSVVPLFIETNVKDLPKQALPGDILSGTFMISENSAAYRAEYIVPTKVGNGSKYDPSLETPSLGNDDKAGAVDDSTEVERTETGALEKAMKDMQISWIKKTPSISVRDKLVAKLMAAAETEEDKMTVLMAHLESLDTYNRSAFPWDSNVGMTAAGAHKVIEIADQVVEKTQATALTAALYTALDQAMASKEDREAKAAADQAKALIIAAIKAKCYAAAFLAANGVFLDKGTEFNDNAGSEQMYKSALNQLLSWEDYRGSGMESMVFGVTSLVLEKQYATALTMVLVRIKGTPLLASNAAERSLMSGLRQKLLEKLGWTLWTDYFKTAAKFTAFENYQSF